MVTLSSIVIYLQHTNVAPMDLVVGIDVLPLDNSYSLNDDTVTIKQSTYIVISTLTYDNQKSL